MTRLSYLPARVYLFLYQFKHLFRCPQARHFLLFCSMLVALIIHQGKGKIKSLVLITPKCIKYWALMRMIRSKQWDPTELLHEMSRHVLRTLPPPSDLTLHLMADKTLKEKRGENNPFCRKTRINQYAPYSFGIEVVILLVSWGTYRIAVDIEVMDPKIAGHQNILFREMLERFNPPKWASNVIVEADSGFSSNQNIKAIEKKGYYYVLAIPRTRKFANGKYVRDLVKHLPKTHYHRVATRKVDGRRKDYWVYSKREKLNGLGEVTILLSKRRRNEGPKNVKIIVTNLKGATDGEILSNFARRWQIEVAIKELKSGLHLGQMQVSKEAGRIKRSMVLSVAAYLLLVHLYGREAGGKESMSLFKLKQRFTTEVYEEALESSRKKWKEKLKKLKAAA